MRKRLFSLLAALLLLPLPICSAEAPEPEVTALVPVGQTVGLELELDGVYVVKFDSDPVSGPARDAGLKEGDQIISVNGTRISRVEELQARIEEAHGDRLVLLVLRNGKSMSFALAPTATASGWRIGVYVRDRISGLGTVTFFDPESGVYGAVGHGVNGTDHRLLVFTEGSLSRTEVVSVRKGAAGSPGALQGASCRGEALGTVEENTAQGIFGHGDFPVSVQGGIPIARPEEIALGPAEIWSNVAGSETCRYTVEIEGISFGDQEGKNLRLHVTDQRLLEQTGGIVQGMSGSPIIQNGRLVGAVTHVLIQDPTRGYGVSIGTMLEASRLWQEACSARAA